MTTVLLAMLVTIGVALAVLALVAIPRVREGEKILTPEGETAMQDARRRARTAAADARTRAVDVRTRAVDVRTRAVDARQRAVAARVRSTSPSRAEQESLAPGPRPGGSVAAQTVTMPETAPGAEGEKVIDLREPRRPESAARQRIARALEWGEPEPGPRHRR